MNSWLGAFHSNLRVYQLDRVLPLDQLDLVGLVDRHLLDHLLLQLDLFHLLVLEHLVDLEHLVHHLDPSYLGDLVHPYHLVDQLVVLECWLIQDIELAYQVDLVDLVLRLDHHVRVDLVDRAGHNLIRVDPFHQ